MENKRKAFPLMKCMSHLQQPFWRQLLFPFQCFSFFFPLFVFLRALVSFCMFSLLLLMLFTMRMRYRKMAVQRNWNNITFQKSHRTAELEQNKYIWQMANVKHKNCNKVFVSFHLFPFVLLFRFICFSFGIFLQKCL